VSELGSHAGAWKPDKIIFYIGIDFLLATKSLGMCL
jgi:hypothetical protein